MKIKKPEYFKEYSYQLSISLTHDGNDLSHIIHSTLKLGSPAGFFAENFIANTLIDHTDHVPSRGFDLLSKQGKPIEIKGMNKRGVDLSPSDMKGKGRKFDKERFELESSDKDFIVANTSDLSKGISFFILPGDFVVANGPKLTISKSEEILNINSPTEVDW